MATDNQYKKKGSVEVGKIQGAAIFVGGYKRREIKILPSKLSYDSKRRGAKASSILLGPLGMTQIIQIKEKILLLVSSVKREDFEFRKQMTLKFENRDEREDWMKALIAECDTNYFEALVDEETDCTDKFIKQTNQEIWNRIMSPAGDESLRRAFIAAPGSAHLELVRIMVGVAIDWIKLLVDVPRLQTLHKEVFVDVLSLLLNDTCARVMLTLLRPDEDFLAAYKYARGQGSTDLVHINDPVKKAKFEKNYVVHSFVKLVRESMASEGWKPFRSFLMILGHPCMTQEVEQGRTFWWEQEVEAGVELTWMKKYINTSRPVSWETVGNALNDAPFLSYYFIAREIEDVITDQRIRKVLRLMAKVPVAQQEMSFEADRVAKPLRPHFLALIDYCKFRELWKLLYPHHEESSKFFDAVHREIWSRIVMTDDVMLSRLFLPTKASTTVPTFRDVLTYEFIVSANEKMLESLHITVESATGAPAGGRVADQDAFAAIDALREFAITRLKRWVFLIMRGEEGTLETAAGLAQAASVYTSLLVAATKSTAVRAVLWLTLPDMTASRHEPHHSFPSPPLAFCEVFISLLEEMADSRSKTDRFRSFLQMCEHPLGVSETRTCNWQEELAWMKRYTFRQPWLLSLNEWALALNDSPYLSFQLLVRRFQMDSSNYPQLLRLLESFPMQFRESSFLADINMCGVARFGSSQHRRTALHFLDYVDSRRVLEMWKLVQSFTLQSSTEFEDEAQNQLLLHLSRQRDTVDTENGFQTMMANLVDLATDDVSFIAFPSVIPHLLRLQLVGSEVLQCLFPAVSSNVPPQNYDVIKYLGGELKKFVEFLSRWTLAFFDCPTFTADMAAGFVDLFSASLTSMTVRALLVLMAPLRRVMVEESLVATAPRRLHAVVLQLLKHRSDPLYYYLLHLLKHPGVVLSDDSSLREVSVSWEDESKWLTTTQQSVQLAFDEIDFTLLSSPSFLLFRYISRNFKNINAEVIHTTVDQVQRILPPRAIDSSFSAQVNYYSCAQLLSRETTAPVHEPHFDHLLRYSLFYKIWGKLMTKLNNESLDVLFVNHIMFRVWTAVSSGHNSSNVVNLARVFNPSKSAIHWPKPMTYLIAMQRYAVLSMFVEDSQLLPKVCHGFVPPADEVVATENVVGAHDILVNQIKDWTYCLLEKRTTSPEDCAAVFVELFIAAFADVAFRGFLMIFQPALSTIEEYRRTAECTDPTNLQWSAVQFVRNLAATFRRSDWLEFRSFLAILKHPITDAGKRSEAESTWKLEAVWIRHRHKVKPQIVTYLEFQYLMTSNPYILLLTVSKAIERKEDQRAALKDVPSKYLNAHFSANFVSTISRSGEAPHFVAMCLGDTSEVAVKVFQERNMINDEFFESLFKEACMNLELPRLLHAYNLLQHSLIDSRENWRIDMLKLTPNISSVVVNFLYAIGKQEMFRRDEMMLGKMVMLVLQLEASRTHREVLNAGTLLREWLLQDPQLVTRFFDMLKSLNFVKWFSRLCVDCNQHYGKAMAPRVPSPVVAYNVYDSDDDSDADPAGVAAEADETELVIVASDMELSKSRLSLSILGFFNICVEFRPEVLHDFIRGLGNGRPFFAYFLHAHESLSEHVLTSLCRIMEISSDSQLHKRIFARQLFYDNDHAQPHVVDALTLVKTSCSSQNLSDAEFTDMLTVAMFTLDTVNLCERFESAVKSLLADQNRRRMTARFFSWIVQYYVSKDCLAEHLPTNTKATERLKWTLCQKFGKEKFFEEVIECALSAATASHLLRNNARSGGYSTLEALFRHYICNSSPTNWLELFRGSKTIAYFIKYVDVEDLNLAFAKFFELNPQNYCFFTYLLKVRRILLTPIVSGKDLVKLTASASSFDEKNSNKFFNQLLKKAEGLHPSEIDLKFIYRITASWMKISKEKVLFPLPPRNAQYLTLLTVMQWANDLLRGHRTDIGRALIAQVGTGEGKSLIIAMAAIYTVKVLRKRVHVLENNAGLLDKDIEQMKPLFAEFGIKPRPDGATASAPGLSSTSEAALLTSDCRSEFSQYGVTYCLRPNLERYYSDSILKRVKEPPLANTVLIVDEVDDLIVDKNPNQAYATADCERDEFQAACEFFKDYDEPPEEREDSFVWQLTQSYAMSAKQLVLGQDYCLMNGKFVGLVGEEGRKTYNTAYDYEREYLQYTQLGIRPEFKTCYYYLSIPYMLQQYDCITGFSGSLGSPAEREFLTEQYKTWCFDTPSFLNTCTDVHKVPPRLMGEPRVGNVSCVHAYESRDEQLAKVVSLCLEKAHVVPVLVIAKSTDEAVFLRTKLAEAMTNISMLPGERLEDYLQLFLEYQVGTTYLDKSNWGKIVERATAKQKDQSRHCITVTDPFGGRGHDFDVHDDEVDQAGGLAVIMTSIPPSEREWRQWKGRTARKDNKGQYAVVLCKEDSPIKGSPHSLREFEFRTEQGIAIQNFYGEKVIDKLLELQDAGQKANLRKLEKDMKKGKRLNRLCDAFYAKYGAMKEEHWPNAKQVELRNVLNFNHLLTDDSITEAFKNMGLEEHDPNASVQAPPVIDKPDLWTEEDVLEWEALCEESQRLQAAQPSLVLADDTESVIAAEPAGRAPVQAESEEQRLERRSSFVGNNPLADTNRMSMSFTGNPLKPQAASASALMLSVSVEDDGSVPPSALTPVRSQLAGNVKEARQVFEQTNRKSLSLRRGSSQVIAQKAPMPASVPVSYRALPPPPPGKPTATPARSDSPVDELPPYVPAARSTAAKVFKNVIEKAETRDDFSEWDYTQPADMPPVSSVRRIHVTKPAAVPTTVVVKVEAEEADLTADADDLAVMEDVVLAEEPAEPEPLIEETIAEKKVVVAFDKSKYDRKKKEEAEAEAAAASAAATAATAATTSPATTPTTIAAATTFSAAGNTTISSMTTGGGGFAGFSTISAMTTTGITGTTQKDAMNLANAVSRIQETVKLTHFTVGDTKKLVFPFKPGETMIDKLRNVDKKEPGLTVGVYDIAGSNAGNGVSGLEVTGTIIKTFTNYTLVLKCTVVGSPYTLALYGLKRLEAKWKEVTVFEGQVTFEPALTVRPNTTFAFINAKNSNAITSRGVVHITSKDDPRSGTAPVFPDIKVNYDGSSIHLPTNLPDCVVTVTPELQGFAKSNLKFVLFNSTKVESELQVSLSPADLVGGEWRVILTWNEHPKDLDLYCKTDFLTEPVFWYNKNLGGQRDPAKGCIELDIDVRDGRGPETITFSPNATKRYRFYVHNYTGGEGKTTDLPISASGAKVLIVNGEGEEVFLNIPTDIVVVNKKNGTFWHVFDLILGRVVPVNQVVGPNPADLSWQYVRN